VLKFLEGISDESLNGKIDRHKLMNSQPKPSSNSSSLTSVFSILQCIHIADKNQIFFNPRFDLGQCIKATQAFYFFLNFLAICYFRYPNKNIRLSNWPTNLKTWHNIRCKTRG
jgi:hypothetical protein